jgi:hypothetical protein
VILVIGVGLVHTGHESGDPIAAVGSLIVLLGMLMFGWIVIGRQRRGQAAGKRLTPAE